MWTERIMTLDNINDIKIYLENENCFHDYVFGNFFYDGKTAIIHMEEPPTKNDLSNDKGLMWNFKFEDINMFYIENDCFFRLINNEVRVENDEVIFELKEGVIRIKADTVSLGIPSIPKVRETNFESLELTINKLMLGETIKIWKNKNALEIRIESMVDIDHNFKSRIFDINPCFGIDKLNISNWKDKYIDYGVMDGTQWDLKFKEKNKPIKTISGSNAYPKEWSKLMKILMNIHPMIKEVLKR